MSKPTTKLVTKDEALARSEEAYQPLLFPDEVWDVWAAHVGEDLAAHEYLFSSPGPDAAPKAWLTAHSTERLDKDWSGVI